MGRGKGELPTVLVRWLGTVSCLLHLRLAFPFPLKVSPFGQAAASPDMRVIGVTLDQSLRMRGRGPLGRTWEDAVPADSFWRLGGSRNQTLTYSVQHDLREAIRPVR